MCQNFPERMSALNYVFFRKKIKERKGSGQVKNLLMDRGHFTDSFVISYDSFSAGYISQTARLFYGKQKFNSHLTETGTSLKLHL